MSHQDPSTETILEPALTAFDVRVLRALEPWPDVIAAKLDRQRLPWRNAWQVAEAMREDDVALVRRTLNGLAHLGYADGTMHSDYRRRWLRSWRGDEALEQR